MYANPAHIRTKRVNLSLSETELRAIEAISELNNMQTSAFIRELVFDALKAGHVLNSGAQPEQMRAAA